MTEIIKLFSDGGCSQMNSTELIGNVEAEYEQFMEHELRRKMPITYWTCFYGGWIAGRFDMLGRKNNGQNKSKEASTTITKRTDV